MTTLSFFRSIVLGVAMIWFTIGGRTAQASVFQMSGTQTSLQFVTVGDPGNKADPVSGSGAVGHVYRIGKYDVTLAQYTQFLTAVAATDSYGLYSPGMAQGHFFGTFGISQSGSPGNYTYAVTGNAPGAANMPVSCVSWGDAARFCNWLQNGQPIGSEGNGTTETGAYTLSGATSNATLIAITRNAGATYFIPTEDEGYKPAYYKSGGTNAGYWSYPTRSNTAPINSLSLASTSTNDANYFIGGYTDPTNLLTPVGTFTASPGAYGTYDMGGDVMDWSETTDGMYFILRGGAFVDSAPILSSSLRSADTPSDESDAEGFRVASSVPEPSSGALALAGIAVFAAQNLRVRRKARRLMRDSSSPPRD